MNNLEEYHIKILDEINSKFNKKVKKFNSNYKKGRIVIDINNIRK
jgi:hypothetical protein